MPERSTPQPSAVQWLQRLRDREMSARELSELYLKRLEHASASLNAVVACDPERVLTEADAADRALSAGERRPLLGLPITVKDVLDVAGYRTSGGSCVRPNHLAQTDATTIGRLRAAGAVVLAKTNTPEASSSSETDNALWGRTNHPLDASRTPGGSSGGEAALLGADASIVGVGTDGGSSIRAPSHFCGIVGLRPTSGLTPETGVWPPTRASGMHDLTCVGPMGRFVEDLTLLLREMVGPDWIDPFVAPVPLGVPTEVKLAGLRVAVYDDDGTVSVTAGTRRAVALAAEALRAAGCTVIDVSPPESFRTATDVFFEALSADGGANLLAHCGGDVDRHPQFEALLESFATAEASAADAYLRHQRLFELRSRVRRWVAGFDLVVCPVASGPAPLHGEPPAGVPPERYMRYEAFNACHTYAVGGLPAVSVPVASEAGLPVGVQIVAAAYRDDMALAGAAAVERAYGGFLLIPERLAATEV